MKAPRYTDEKFLLSEAQIGKGSDLGYPRMGVGLVYNIIFR